MTHLDFEVYKMAWGVAHCGPTFRILSILFASSVNEGILESRNKPKASVIKLVENSNNDGNVEGKRHLDRLLAASQPEKINTDKPVIFMVGLD
jgi:hypothetical protein